MLSKYAIFNHTSEISIRNDDILKFLDRSKDIQEYYLKKNSVTNLKKYRDYKAIVVICCGNEFKVEDFEIAISQLRHIFHFSKQLEFGWHLHDSLEDRYWDAHILLGK